MKLGDYYAVAAFFGLFSLIGLEACQDQGTRYSYQDTDPGAYDLAAENSYDALLQRYVDSKNLVHYDQWHQSRSDSGQLKTVLDQIAKADDSTMSADQRKAFYINAYNAMTLDLILSHYEETLGGASSPYPKFRSIRNISNLDNKVWDRFQWTVAGKPRTLNEIENRILRPMGDARIHFAIVCASMGCPPLHPHAFTASTLSLTLDSLASSFVNSGRNTKFDPSTATVHTSQILDWFEADFTKTFGSIQGFFAKYVQVIPARDTSKYKVDFNDYDWTLNQATEPQASPSPSPSPSGPPAGSGSESEVPPPPSGSGTERELN